MDHRRPLRADTSMSARSDVRKVSTMVDGIRREVVPSAVPFES